MLHRVFKGANLLILAILVLSLALFVFIVTPTGLPEIDSNKATKIYFADNISPGHQKVIEEFNRRFTGSIEVVPINLPFTKFSTNERKQLLTRALRSKSARLDIFAVDLIWIPRFVKWAQPLTDEFLSEERDIMLEYTLEACYYDNELYGIPLYVDIGLLYYRRDLLQVLHDFDEIEKKLKRSISWEEFIALSERLTFQQKPYYVFPADNYEGLVCSFVEMLSGQTSTLFLKESLLLETPKAQRGLKLLVDLVNRHGITPEEVTEFREADAYEYALENDAIFFRGWPGNLNTYLDEYADKIAEIGVCALPHFEGQPPGSVYGGWSMMISKHSKKRPQAIEFLKFATSLEMQKIFFREMGYLPVNNQLYKDVSFLEEHPEFADYGRYLEMGFHRPAAVDYTKISDVLSYYLKLAIKEELPVSIALKKAREQVNSEKVLIR